MNYELVRARLSRLSPAALRFLSTRSAELGRLSGNPFIKDSYETLSSLADEELKSRFMGQSLTEIMDEAKALRDLDEALAMAGNISGGSVNVR